jgi:predicted ferric reductase
MNWNLSGQYISDILALLLIIRLATIRVRLPNVYRVFGAFLGFQLLESLVSLTLYKFQGQVDYRLIWMALRLMAWALSLAMVYALLGEILKGLPGILKFSRVLLNVIFALALAVSLATVIPEYAASGGAKYKASIDRALIFFYVLDRAVAMAALLVLICILAFILWFPVEMRRNLAVLSVGLVTYFGAKAALLLLHTYFAHDSIVLLGKLIALVLAVCYAYWILFINPKGQFAEVRLGHVWRQEDQGRLIGQLESMNTALLRAGARR